MFVFMCLTKTAYDDEDFDASELVDDTDDSDEESSNLSGMLFFKCSHFGLIINEFQ